MLHAGYSLLYQRGLLKVNDFMSPLLSVAAADSWSERLFLVQLSKSTDVLETTANVLLEVDAPLDSISWFKGIINILRYVRTYVRMPQSTYSTYIQKFSHTYIHNIHTYTVRNFYGDMH